MTSKPEARQEPANTGATESATTGSRAWKLHDNVNTDEIIPGRYNVTTDRQSLAEHCLCEVRPDFPGGVRSGDVIVGGRNFGCGSSREHAPIAIQACGVSAVIAPSFARIFYRNAVNVGLPVLTCSEASKIQEGDDLQVDPLTGSIVNLTRNESHRADPLPPFVAQIAAEGGILGYVKKYGWDHPISDSVAASSAEPSLSPGPSSDAVAASPAARGGEAQ